MKCISTLLYIWEMICYVRVPLLQRTYVYVVGPSRSGSGRISACQDSDYLRRCPKAGSKFERWKEMEDLVFTCFNREASQAPQPLTDLSSPSMIR